MKVTNLLSVERLSPSSDLDEKLVTICAGGTGTVPSVTPVGERSSRKIGDVTPKLGSGTSLFQTLGRVPSATAVGAGTPASGETAPGRACPTTTVLAVPWYWLRDRIRVPGGNPAAWAAEAPRVDVKKAAMAAFRIRCERMSLAVYAIWFLEG